MSFENKNYLLLVDNICPNFASEGWSDGYADLPDDSKEIIKQLYGKISNNKLVECIVDYLNGYEIGCEMSEHIEDVYDEDGNIKDGWAEAKPIFEHENDAKLLIKKHIKGLNAKDKASDPNK